MKAAVRRCWQLGMKMQEKGVWKSTKRKKKIKRCIYQSKKEFQEQFGRKMNHDVNRNRKLSWKEVENSNRIKDGNGRLALEEAEV